MNETLNYTIPGKKLFEGFYKEALNKINGGILFINEDASQAEGNASFLKIHGWDENKPLNISGSLSELYNLYDIKLNKISFDKWPIVKLLNRQEFQDEKYILEIIETGKRFFASYSGYPQYDEKGKYKGGIFLLNDMTELADTRNRLEEEVFQKNKYHHELEKYQQQLKDDRELLQTIIDTIPVMITIYEKRFESILLNHAFVKITGWTEEDTKSTNIMELAYPDPDYRAEIYNYVQSLKPGFKDILLRTKDGRDIQTSWANVEIPDGRQVGVGLDISERKKLEYELISAKENAEKANQIQLSFIQSISHEVRTPLNSILGYTELLHKYVKGRDELEFLNAIDINGRQLLRLIDDIIDFSRLDNMDLKIRKENIRLNKLIEQIHKQVPRIKKSCKKKHLKIRLNIPKNGNEDIVLNTDEVRLQQILTNLLSNAIQYTNDGEIEVGYRIEPNKILFYVKDKGIGIKAEDYSRVFQRFTRLHDTSKTEVRGTGLGLAICKHLVELLGGEIWFESEFGKGTVFYFTHPFDEQAVVAKRAKKTGAGDASVPDLTGYTLLIVEDDTFSYGLMHHMLSETKASILHADTGFMAIELVMDRKIDFVFLDIRLPGMDGYQVLNHIRSIKKDLPVVAQTANALPEDIDMIQQAGFSSYITKPISQSDLFVVLNTYLSHQLTLF